MREELVMFVNDNYPPIKQKLFTEAFELFDDYGIEDYDTPFMEMLDVYDNSDYCTFITGFESLFVTSLLSIIKEHGITLVEDVLLSQIVMFAQSLLEIQSYEDKDTIIRILETDYDNHAKLGELFALVTEEKVETIAMIIEDMDQNIFLQLASSISEEDSSVSDPVEELESSKVIIKNLKEFRQFTGFNDAIGFKIIEMGFKVGSSFEIYGRYLKQFIQDYTDINKVAKEYFIILLMSKESYISPLSYYRKISSDYIDDLNIVTKIDQELNKIQNDFDKFKSNTIFDQTNRPENYYTGIGTDHIPVGRYDGLMTGYEAVFSYKNKEYKIINKKVGIKGKNIEGTILKHSSGYFTVEFPHA